jgi:hypothetical protein
MVTVAENNGGFTVWRRGLAERLRRPKGEETAARIAVVAGLLRELGDRREQLQAAIASAAEEEAVLADRGGDYTDAAKIRARRSRAEWDLRQLASAETPLLEELTELRSRQRQETLERFQVEQRSQIENGLELIEQAFARFAAARQVWERASAQGFQLLTVPDIWTADVLERLKSQLAGEPFPRLQPQPVVRVPISERKPLPHEAIGHGAASYAPSPPVRPPVRALRHDGPPRDGEAQVVLLRAGIELGDGFTGLAGDIVNLPAAQALELIRHSAADYTAVSGG